MREILYAGHRFVTTDALSDAVLDYVVEATAREVTDTLAIPVLVDGAVETLRVLITPTIELGTISVPGLEAELPGEGAALAALESRFDERGGRTIATMPSP
jgi:hypothetical protein